MILPVINPHFKKNQKWKKVKLIKSSKSQVQAPFLQIVKSWVRPRRWVPNLFPKMKPSSLPITVSHRSVVVLLSFALLEFLISAISATSVSSQICSRYDYSLSTLNLNVSRTLPPISSLSFISPVAISPCRCRRPCPCPRCRHGWRRWMESEVFSRFFPALPMDGFLPTTCDAWGGLISGALARHLAHYCRGRDGGGGGGPCVELHRRPGSPKLHRF